MRDIIKSVELHHLLSFIYSSGGGWRGVGLFIVDPDVDYKRIVNRNKRIKMPKSECVLVGTGGVGWLVDRNLDRNGCPRGCKSSGTRI